MSNSVFLLPGPSQTDILVNPVTFRGPLTIEGNNPINTAGLTVRNTDSDPSNYVFAELNNQLDNSTLDLQIFPSTGTGVRGQAELGAISGSEAVDMSLASYGGDVILNTEGMGGVIRFVGITTFNKLTEPSNADADQMYLYCVEVGGKLKLYAKFHTGVQVLIASEP